MTKILLASLFAFFIPTAAFAGEWISDRENGCKIWNPAPSYGESIRWNGKCQNGFAEGQGEVLWYVNGVDSEKTVAKFKGGKIDGNGTWEFICGGPANNKIKRYRGEFQENVRNGFAHTEYCDGTTDNGWWENNGFVYDCNSHEDCKKVADQRGREESARDDKQATEKAGDMLPIWNIDFPKSDAWKVAHSERKNGTQIIEYTADGEKVESWSQLVTFMYIPLAKEKFQAAVKSILSGIETGCSSSKSQTLAESEYMFTHRWSGEGCGGLPSQEEVARYEYADAGFVLIKYTYYKHKSKPDFEAWIRRVIEAKITH